MSEESMQLSLKLAKTLWFNNYRAVFHNLCGEFVASSRIVPCIPLEKSEIPPDAPDVEPFLTVIVEDADLAEDQLVSFESGASPLLLERISSADFAPEYCLFFYPSPSLPDPK
jgi:hypothetical protein